jgi:hypothetical protein
MGRNRVREPAGRDGDQPINHLRLGTGAGTVRGLQWESQVDQGTSNSLYNWLWGLTDGAAGSSNWIYQDVINNVIRLQLGQLNIAGGNNQTALNAAGTGNVLLQLLFELRYGRGRLRIWRLFTVDRGDDRRKRQPNQLRIPSLLCWGL